MRAETLQVLTGHTVESLLDLYRVWRFANKVNREGQVRHFERSHICSVSHSHNLGLLHAHNLCVAPAALNKAHGTKHFGHGKFISRSSILSEHRVHPNETKSAVLDRVIAYLGSGVVSEVIKIAKLQPSQKDQHLRWLRLHLDSSDHEHRKHLAKLDTMSTKALNELRAAVQHKLPPQDRVKRYTFVPFRVLYLELERHSAFRPDLQDLFDEIQRVDGWKTSVGIWKMNAVEEQALFDVLHGRPLLEVQDVLDEFTSRNTPIIDTEGLEAYGCDIVVPIYERTPAYAPIMFNLIKPASSASQLNRPFADMVDDELLELDTSWFRAPAWEAHHNPSPF